MDAPLGNHSYHIDLCLFRYLYRCHPLQSQAEGYRCLCTKVHTLGHNFFQLVVEKIIHQDLAVVKYCHPCVDRLVQQQLAFAHVDSEQVVCKHNMP